MKPLRSWLLVVLAAIIGLGAGIAGVVLLNCLGAELYLHRHYSDEYSPNPDHVPLGLVFGSTTAVVLLGWVVAPGPALTKGIGWLFPLNGQWLKGLLAPLLWMVTLAALFILDEARALGTPVGLTLLTGIWVCLVRGGIRHWSEVSRRDT